MIKPSMVSAYCTFVLSAWSVSHEFCPPDATKRVQALRPYPKKLLKFFAIGEALKSFRWE